jgi:hypothetical protein
MRDDLASQVPKTEAESTRRQRVRLAHLEADLAYFQTRLEIIGDPQSSNQNAQRKVFEVLFKTFGNHIVRMKKRMAEN